MVINRRKLWKTVLQSWGFTLMGVFNIVVLLLFASLLAARFAGSGVLVAVIMPTFAFSIAAFLLGEVVVNIIFDARVPHPEHDRRFIESMKRVRKKSRMWIMPRGRIMQIGQPNAMAYGPGLPGLCAVGVSRDLVEMLTDEELDGVIGHEFAHIKCRDTGILAVIGLVLGMIDKLRKILTSRNTLAMQSPIVVAVGWLIYGIGRAAFYISRFSISQEREIAADALGAYYNGDPKPLISALRKLHAWGKKHKSDTGPQPILKDLMVAHPGLDERIASLENLIDTPVLLLQHKEGSHESGGQKTGGALNAF